MSDLIMPDLHPSQFQNNTINKVSNNTKSTKTFVDLNNEKNNIDVSSTIKDTVDRIGLPPKSFPLTENDTEFSESNTGYTRFGETSLTYLFFSKDNITNIQNVIKMLVHKQLNYVISNQSITDLEIIMRSIFLAYSEHPPLIDSTMSSEQILMLQKLYTKEVARLNELVINTTVPLICSQIQQYLDYLRDSSSGLRTIPRSINTSNSGEKQYRSITNVLLGSSL